jgi:hypothetical protein
MEGTCSGNFCFVRFLKFKMLIMLGKEPFFWVFLDFRAHPQAIALTGPKIQEDPEKSCFPPIHSLVFCSLILVPALLALHLFQT